MYIHIILVSPSRAENVGAAARAMKTMGFQSLRIVDSEAHSQPAARWVAHGSGDILDNIQTYPTLQQALVGMDFTVATTARSRARFRYYLTPAQLLTQLNEKQSWIEQMALVFGREESGLTNDELMLADLLTGVPMQAEYPSLNLGQAVMVYCYQLASLISSQKTAKDTLANPGQLSALRRRVEGLLGQIEAEEDEKLRDWLHQRLGLLAQRDTAMLHTLLHDIEKNITK